MTLIGAATRRRRGERGSMSVEVVLLAPVLFMFVMLVVAAGRYVAVRGDIEATARDAARAASMQLSYRAANRAAGQIVARSLDEGTSCNLPVTLGGDWGPGGTVVVHLDCQVSYDGLGLIGLPGSVSMDVHSAAPLDPYRRYDP